MNARRCRSVPKSRLPRGFSMLEVLVTLLIVTIWLLSTAGLQASSAKLTKVAQHRTAAVLLASEMAERMEANKPAAAAGSYAYACDPCAGVATSSACVGSACTTDALATFDLAEWGARVGAVLPASSATIVWNMDIVPPAYTITLNWAHRRDNRAYSTTGSAEAAQYVATKQIFFDPG
jgi:type IV pilus assembly protein PilV